MTHDNVTDIVEALHRHAFDDCGGFAGIIDNHVATEAAREIATLRKQLENAREALVKNQWELEMIDRTQSTNYRRVKFLILANREALKGPQ